MLKSLLRNLLVNAVGLFLASQFIGGFHLANGLKSLAIVTLVFTGVHIFIKPLLKALLGPINFLTLGLISLIIDSVILYALSVFLPQVTFSDWSFSGINLYNIILPAYNFNPIGSTIVSAILINLIRSTLSYLASP